MQSLDYHGGSHVRQSFLRGTLVFAIVCSGFVGTTLAQYYGGHGDIVYPEPVGSRIGTGDSKSEDSDMPVPVELASMLNDIDSVDEFLQLLQNVPEGNKRPTLANRFGGIERSNAIFATPAKCIPELQPVSLNLDHNSSIIIYPSCTRVKRCGGCCNSEALSCQPTATEMRNFEVIEATIGMRYTSRRIVPLEEHTACKCDCRIKNEHCTEKQHYEPHNCMCVCSNTDERDKCWSNDAKIWDPSRCVCSCKKVEMCSSGLYFNHNTCRCQPILLPKLVNRYATTKGANYNLSNNQRQDNMSSVIIVLDASDPRRKPKEDPERK